MRTWKMLSELGCLALLESCSVDILRSSFALFAFNQFWAFTKYWKHFASQLHGNGFYGIKMNCIIFLGWYFHICSNHWYIKIETILFHLQALQLGCLFLPLFSFNFWTQISRKLCTRVWHFLSVFIIFLLLFGTPNMSVDAK